MKVVDTQVMLHRATDYAKETSIQQKRNDHAQQLLKEQGHVENEYKAIAVPTTNETSEQQAVNRDGHNESQNPGNEKKDKKDKKRENNVPILDERNPLLADMSFETVREYDIPKPRIDIDI